MVHIFHDPSTIMGWVSHFQLFYGEVQQNKGPRKIKVGISDGIIIACITVDVVL